MRRFILTALFSLGAAGAAHADQVWVTMDQVRPFQLKQEADQIVVGNPGIADVTVLDKTRLLLFGKAIGMTNIFLLDANGEPIENLIVRVRSGAADLMVLQRGAQRISYNCTTLCEAAVTVGDSAEVFQNVSTQNQQKQAQASGSGGSGQ